MLPANDLPRRGTIVDFTWITNAMLPDSPCLEIEPGKVVQDAHLPALGVLLDSEAWENSKWKYIRTTDEWIPIFKLVEGDVEAMVDIVESKDYDPNWIHTMQWWVTPKDFPREED